MTDYANGGDQKTIARIAERVFGGYPGLFAAHGWDWPGNQAMNRAATLLAERYGNIRTFEEKFDVDAFSDDPFAGDPEVWITSFWGYTPEKWGCVGFTQAGRLRTLRRERTFPFLMVIYVTEGSPDAAPHDRGKVMGFYELSELTGDRDLFTAADHHSLSPKSWRHSFKALRAYEILPEYRPHIRDFDPTIREEGRELAVSKNGAQLPSHSVEILKSLPRREVPVFGVQYNLDFDIVIPGRGDASSPGKGYVQGGAGRRLGYEVREPKGTEKELYVLKLSGDPEAFLGRPCDGQDIFKVGLSISPKTRAQALNKAMPRGAFSWDVHLSTVWDGHPRYSCFEVAEKGEMAMKLNLASLGERHLGGEFYLASESEIERAWSHGREAALKREKATK